MKQVLVAAPTEKGEFFRNSILSRPDIHAIFGTDINLAMQTYFLTQPELYIIYDPNGIFLPSFMADLARQSQAASSVIVLTDKDFKDPLPGPVKKVFSTDIDEASFNESVAAVLDLPTRKSLRVPIRIGVSLSQSDSTTIANTINISGGGMLVESLKPLIPGQKYEFRFMGVKSAMNVAAIAVRVLREEGAGRPGSNAKLYAMEFLDMSAQKMESMLANLAEK